MINLKRCKKCKQLFDMDTSKDWCPECRNINKDGCESCNLAKSNKKWKGGLNEE